MVDTRATTSQTDVGPAVGPTFAIADPGPLGLAAFRADHLRAQLRQRRLAQDRHRTVVIGLALFYGGLAQFAAGMWEFRKNNTFGAVAFTSYGGFWLSFAGILFFYKPEGVSADQASHAVGFYLLTWTIFTAYMTVASVRVSGAVFAVLAFLTLRFLLLAIGNLSVNAYTLKVGGYLGLITAIVAWYASFAAVTNATWKRTVLPTWPAKAR